MANNKIFIGNTPILDLTGYATEQYVNTQIENVDVTDQLQNYALKSAVDTSVNALNSSINALKDVVSQITGEGADVTAAIDTFNELKEFVKDYTNVNDLSTLINTVKSEAVADAATDAATKYQPIGTYATESYVATEIASALTNPNASIGALNTSVNAIETALVNKIDGDGTVTKVVKLSAAAYAALETKDAKTVYIVTE